MKRVANKIAVQSLLYTVSGNQLLRIIDYPTQNDCLYKRNGEIAFDDHACAINSYKYVRLAKAELLRTSFEVNMAGHPVLILEVSTKYEEY